MKKMGETPLDQPNEVILRELKKQGKTLNLILTILTTIVAFGLGYGSGVILDLILL